MGPTGHCIRFSGLSLGPLFHSMTNLTPTERVSHLISVPLFSCLESGSYAILPRLQNPSKHHLLPIKSPHKCSPSVDQAAASMGAESTSLLQRDPQTSSPAPAHTAHNTQFITLLLFHLQIIRSVKATIQVHREGEERDP